MRSDDYISDSWIEDSVAKISVHVDDMAESAEAMCVRLIKGVEIDLPKTRSWLRQDGAICLIWGSGSRWLIIEISSGDRYRYTAIAGDQTTYSNVLSKHVDQFRVLAAWLRSRRETPE